MNKDLIDEMLNKSQEAFLMAIEIYNKPTISYRLEGYAFLYIRKVRFFEKKSNLCIDKHIFYKVHLSY